MFSNLSYRLKTPLALTLVIGVAAAVVAAALTWQAWNQARASFVAHSQSLGKTLASAVRPALLHDDVWQAYEILLTPLGRGRAEGRALILLDAADRIVAATDPHQFPVLEEFLHAAADAALAPLPAGSEQAVREGASGRHLYLFTPVLAEDGAVLGRLVQRYDQSLLGPRYLDQAEGALFAALIALILLLPLGWLAGKRLAEPLTHLADCLGRVGRELPETIRCEFPHGRDEIGQLATRFQGMVEELREKQALENHLAQSDRLAVVGRLSAGIAHEINNPLGGMLNAISNYRRRGGADPQADKTLALIERGLTQIRDTVSALLVETRMESRALTPDDLEDVRTLIAAEIQARSLRLDWCNEVREALPLPSAQVRQILLNLLLNAAQASPEKGEMSAVLEAKDGCLALRVGNSGQAIPERRRQHLFEPYFGTGEVHGLGLWVTYQLVTQLRGEIEVDSVPGHTRFTVRLPLEALDET